MEDVDDDNDDDPNHQPPRPCDKDDMGAGDIFEEQPSTSCDQPDLDETIGGTMDETLATKVGRKINRYQWKAARNTLHKAFGSRVRKGHNSRLFENIELKEFGPDGNG